MEVKTIKESELLKPEAEVIHQLFNHIIDRSKKVGEKLSVLKKQFDLKGFKFEEGGYDEPMVWSHQDVGDFFVQQEDGDGYYVPIAWPDDDDTKEILDKRTQELLDILNLYDDLLGHITDQACPDEDRIYDIRIERLGGNEFPLEVTMRDFDETGWSIWIKTTFHHEFIVEFPYSPKKETDFSLTRIEKAYHKVEMNGADKK